MTLGEWRIWARAQLKHSDSAALDADVLLMHYLQCSRVFLLTHDQQPLNEQQTTDLTALLARRSKGEPIAYITGKQEFWSLSLAVAPCTLIPRADTETLVEDILQRYDHQPRSMLDLGTGTGAILLALLSERPQWQGLGVDISADAVALAKQNAQAHQLQKRATFLQSDWFAAVPATARFDIIISNPPYIAEDDPHLWQGDVRFEPRSALIADSQGLAAYRHICAAAPAFLASGGELIVEHGYQQQSALTQLFKEHGYQNVQTILDLAGQPRVTRGQWFTTN